MNKLLILLCVVLLISIKEIKCQDYTADKDLQASHLIDIAVNVWEVADGATLINDVCSQKTTYSKHQAQKVAEELTNVQTNGRLFIKSFNNPSYKNDFKVSFANTYMSLLAATYPTALHLVKCSKKSPELVTVE